VPIQEGYVSEGVVEGLIVLRGVVQVAAFLFLAQFGLRLLGLRPVVRRSLTALSLLAAAGILGGCALAAEDAGWGAAEWEAAAVSTARYALLVPAAILSAVGLWRQRSELGAAGMTGIRPYAAAAAATLAAYAVVAGLIVERGPVSPGSIGDAGGWFDATSLPLEVVRGLIGLALCVLAVKLLEIFDVEAKQREEELDRARAIAEERARFGRDLHDGTIQSIYAAGLHLESVAIRCEDPSVRREVREVVADLNAATDGIRDYIRDLAIAPATPDGIAAGLGELTRRFAEETGGDVRFAIERPGPCGPLPEEAGQHLEQILREALSNTARHAGGCRVRVSLVLAPDEIDLVVADDGCGLAPVAGGDGRGQGLRNMRERARRLGGRLVVEPAPGGGTRVTLAVPLDSEEPEDEAPAPVPDVRDEVRAT
jgi:signal transduction histidine kinase